MLMANLMFAENRLVGYSPAQAAEKLQGEGLQRPARKALLRQELHLVYPLAPNLVGG